MSRKEEILQYINGQLANEDTEIYLDVDDYKVIVKALEQEPCDDAISRKDAIKVLQDNCNHWETNIMLIAIAEDLLKALPPVTPTRKKGKWINKSHTSDCGIKFVASECTCCGKKTFFDCDQLVYNYCPNCGSKMKNEVKND